MSSINLFDQTVGMLRKVLNFRQTNQSLITANIANAETPGYQPARLHFEKDLQSALSAGREKNATGREQAVLHALDQVQGRVVRDTSAPQIGDKNNVSLDNEMMGLAENQIQYEAAISMMNKKLGLLKYIANDGRG